MRRRRRRRFTRIRQRSASLLCLGNCRRLVGCRAHSGSARSGSTPRCARARLRARSTKGGLWRSHAAITCLPRPSRPSTLPAGGWSRRLFATTHIRGTESAGATGTKAFMRRPTARSGATSPRVARGSTVEPRPLGGAPGHGLRDRAGCRAGSRAAVCLARLDLAWTKSRLDVHRLSCWRPPSRRAVWRLRRGGAMA